MTSPMFIKKEKELCEYIEEYTLGIINVRESMFFQDKLAHAHAMLTNGIKLHIVDKSIDRLPIHYLKEIIMYLTYLLLFPYHLVNRQFIMTYQRTDFPKKGMENTMPRPRNHFDALSGLL